MSCEAAESVEDAIHDNRMFVERAFYCIANGAGELQPFLQLLSRKAESSVQLFPADAAFFTVCKRFDFSFQ